MSGHSGVMLRSSDLFVVSCRLTGRAVFRHQLLLRHGRLIVVPALVAKGTLEQLTQYLKPRLGGASGTGLKSYRLVQSDCNPTLPSASHHGAIDTVTDGGHSSPGSSHPGAVGIVTDSGDSLPGSSHPGAGGTVNDGGPGNHGASQPGAVDTVTNRGHGIPGANDLGAADTVHQAQAAKHSIRHPGAIDTALQTSAEGHSGKHARHLSASAT